MKIYYELFYFNLLTLCLRLALVGEYYALVITDKGMCSS
jgi:hypothetical protein